MERDVATRRGLSSFCSDEHMYAHQYEKQKETRVRQAKVANRRDASLGGDHGGAARGDMASVDHVLQ